MPGKYWSPDEEAKLRELYQGGASLEAMADALERPVDAVKQKLRRLSLLVVRPRQVLTTTRAVFPRDVLTHEQVLRILAGALEAGRREGLGKVEVERLSMLASLARTYDSILEKFERWAEFERELLEIKRRLAAVEWNREGEGEGQGVEAGGEATAPRGG